MSQQQNSAIIFGVGPRQGVGAELCYRAATRGLHVYVNGRTQAKIDAVASHIEAVGGSATPLLADVTQAAEVNKALQAVAADGRPLELAIYNAGNNRLEKFLDVTPEYEDMWRVICFGGFLTAQATLRLMLAQQVKVKNKACCLPVRAALCVVKPGFPLLLPERALCV